MPFCTNCGAEVEETERFCANCGRAQDQIKPQFQSKHDRLSKKSIPIIIAVTVIMVIGVSVMIIFNGNIFVEQANDGLQHVSEVELVRGNSVGNIVNHGIAAKQGDWIYYCNKNDHFKIYKNKTDGRGREKINDDDAWYINVVGDWIYYFTLDDGEKIYKVKIDGSERQQVI
jgi:hypothetical protein